MYFLYHNKKRFLNLQGNLIFTHNAALIRGNNKKATPQHITDGMFVQVLPDTGLLVRLRATRTALAFIWGATKALAPEADEAYRERVRTAEKAATGRKVVPIKPTNTAPDCFGSNPGPQELAENDCIRCEYGESCIP